MEAALLEHGLLGVAVAALSYVVVALYRENKALNAAALTNRDEHEAQLLELADKRLEDQKQATAALRESNGALRAACDGLRQMRRSQPPKSSESA